MATCGPLLILHLGGPNNATHKTNQKWPTIGPSGDITPAVWGIPNTSKRGVKMRIHREGALWLHNPCHPGVPNASTQGTKSEVAHSGRGGYITPTI